MDNLMPSALKRFEMAANEGKVNAEQVISILQSLNYNEQLIPKIASQIKSDIDINQFKELISSKDVETKIQNMTPAQIKQIEDDFRHSIKFGNVEQVSQILNKYQGQIDLVNKIDFTTRQISTFSAVQAPDEQTAFSLLKVLCDHGADVFFKDQMQQTILYYVCRDGRTLLFDQLISKGIQVNDVDNNGQTPLFYAARENRCEIIHRLIQQGANVNFYDTLQEQTALFYSAREGHYQACKILIEAGCKINYQDKTKKTAIYFAKKYNQREVIELLSTSLQKQKEEIHQKKEEPRQQQHIKRKKQKDMSQKQQYILMHVDGQGGQKQVTLQDFERFCQLYPDIGRMISNPDDTIDQQMINSIKMDDGWEKLARKVIATLWRSKYAHLFQEPVDIERFHIYDYPDVIKKPMDFGTIKVYMKLQQDNLNKNVYKSYKEFHNDVILVFDNCIRYNGEHSDFGKFAFQTKQEYQLLFDQYGASKYM